MSNALIRRNHQPSPPQPIPAARNRLLATISGLPVLEFREITGLVQPAFQKAGFAPEIYIQSLQQGNTPRPITINDSGLLDTIYLARPLYLSDQQRATTLDEAKAFVHMAGDIAEGLTDLIFPKNWLGKRRSSSGFAPRPVIAELNMTAEDAAARAAGYAGFLNTLPKYQRALRIAVKEVQAAEDEVADFANFAGFHARTRPDMWMDEEVGAGLILGDGLVTFIITSVPCTANPEIIYENLVDISNRFAGEFGGVLVKNDDFADQVIVGWRNVLSRLGLQPGDPEAREFFSPVH